MVISVVSTFIDLIVNLWALG